MPCFAGISAIAFFSSATVIGRLWPSRARITLVRIAVLAIVLTLSPGIMDMATKAAAKLMATELRLARLPLIMIYATMAYAQMLNAAT